MSRRAQMRVHVTKGLLGPMLSAMTGFIRCLLPLPLLVCVASVLSGQTILNPTDNLQTAVNSAAAGSTLLLNPGTYSLSTTLVVNKALTIRNNQATRPTV